MVKQCQRGPFVWERAEVRDSLGHPRNLQEAQILEWRGGRWPSQVHMKGVPSQGLLKKGKSCSSNKGMYKSELCVYIHIAEAHRSSHQLPLKLLRGNNSGRNVIFIPSILVLPPRQLLFHFLLLLPISSSSAYSSPILRSPGLRSTFIRHKITVPQFDA